MSNQIYGPAQTDANGVLQQIYHQGFEKMPSVDSYGNMELVEKFKGPTEIMKTLPFMPEFKVGNRRPTQTIENNSGLFVTRISAPQFYDNRKFWKITGIEIEESEAGDHATATISYVNDEETISGEEDDEAEEIDDVWELQNLESEESIYAYCTHLTDISCNNYRWLEAWRNPENSTLDYKNFKFTDPELGVSGTLTPAGQAIAKFIGRGTDVVKRWNPTIVRTRYYTKGRINDMAENLCLRDKPDNKCPWSRTLVEKWDWLKIGDDLTVEYANGDIVKQTRVEKWLGSNTTWPNAFYSKDPSERWKTALSVDIEYQNGEVQDDMNDSI